MRVKGWGRGDRGDWGDQCEVHEESNLLVSGPNGGEWMELEKTICASTERHKVFQTDTRFIWGSPDPK